MSTEVDFKGKFTVSQFIDHIGVNKETWILTTYLGLAMLFDGYDCLLRFFLSSVPLMPERSYAIY